MKRRKVALLGKGELAIRVAEYLMEDSNASMLLKLLEIGGTITQRVWSDNV
jgi:hypothetical protein